MPDIYNNVLIYWLEMVVGDWERCWDGGDGAGCGSDGIGCDICDDFSDGCGGGGIGR